MISEVDIRDWDNVNVNEAKKALEVIRENPHEGIQNPVKQLETFVNQVELLRKTQVKVLPALFQPRKE